MKKQQKQKLVKKAFWLTPTQAKRIERDARRGDKSQSRIIRDILNVFFK